MLKILAGHSRGRIIKSLSNAPHLRPILARVKKSLFDILMPRVVGSQFLDLYSGTGAVGLEALSRGARHVTFVERDRRCRNVLNDNLKNLGYVDKADVYALEIPNRLKPLPGPYDLIFMGPPYKDDKKVPLALVTPTMEAIHKLNLCQKKGLVVAQHQKKEPIELPSEQWEMPRQEKYGDTMLSFMKWKQP